MALLIALAALIMVMVAISSGLAAVQVGRQTAAAENRDDHVFSMLTAGERLATLWLRDHARDVVRPPEGGRIRLVAERFETPTGSGALTVDLFDELAAIPGHLLHANGPLRGALPPVFSTVILPQVGIPELERPTDFLESLPLGEGQRRFPLPGPGMARVWRDPAVTARPVPPPMAADRGQSLAEVVGFRRIPRLNVNTAPASVLRAACTFLKQGDATAMLDRRRRGQFVGSPEGLSKDPLHPLLLMESSDAWNALIAVEWNGVRRSWWVVIAGNARSFWIVQRHDATQ